MKITVQCDREQTTHATITYRKHEIYMQFCDIHEDGELFYPGELEPLRFPFTKYPDHRLLCDHYGWNVIKLHVFVLNLEGSEEQPPADT